MSNVDDKVNYLREGNRVAEFNENDCKKLMQKVVVEHLLRNVYINAVPQMVIDRCDHKTYNLKIDVRGCPDMTDARVMVGNHAGPVKDNTEFYVQLHFLDSDGSMIGVEHSDTITYEDAIKTNEAIKLIEIKYCYSGE